MEHINAVIIEDLPIAEEHLKKLLNTHCPNVNIVASFNSGREALPILPKLNFNLLFLDIEYNDGYNAFDLLEDINLENVHIIFTTAYDHYRKQASEANTVKYLLKPIEVKPLKQAVERSMLIMIGQQQINNLKKTHQALSSGKIVLSIKGETLFINPESIVYLEANGAYSQVYYTEGSDLKNIVVSHNLSWFDALLPQKLFLRIHKKYTINTSYVQKCRSNNLILKVGSHKITTSISKDRKKEIVDTIAMNKLNF